MCKSSDFQKQKQTIHIENTHKKNCVRTKFAHSSLYTIGLHLRGGWMGKIANGGFRAPIGSQHGASRVFQCLLTSGDVGGFDDEFRHRAFREGIHVVDADICRGKAA